MQYVYKYERGLIFHRIVYVGITNDLARRHREHLGEDRLFASSRLYYIRVPSRRRARKIESYLIRKYKPALNRAEKNGKPFNLIHMPFMWVRYKGGG